MTISSQAECIVFIRHGESLGNKLKIPGERYYPPEALAQLEGLKEHETPLTDQGRHQAMVAGRWLRRTFGVPNIIYHSGYQRTEDTANLILDAYRDGSRAIDIPVVRSNLLRERRAGYVFRMSKEDVETHFPWLETYYARVGPFAARPPGGESYEDMMERLRQFHQIVPRVPLVFVVGHNGTFLANDCLLQNWSLDKADKEIAAGGSENCGVTVYKRNERGTLSFAEYNREFLAALAA